MLFLMEGIVSWVAGREEGGEGDKHCHVKDDGYRGHGCVKGHAGDARAVGDGRVPLLLDRLAEVELDEQEGEVEKQAGGDDAEEGEAVGADGDEANVGEEEGELKAEDAGDVAVVGVLARASYVCRRDG
jgi:hypothetical protein